jgi:hypothetical protein
VLATWGIRKAYENGLVWRRWLTLWHHCWRRYEINSSDSMAYLSEVEQQRVKQALVVLAAFRTLLEHPYQVYTYYIFSSIYNIHESYPAHTGMIRETRLPTHACR